MALHFDVRRWRCRERQAGQAGLHSGWSSQKVVHHSGEDLGPSDDWRVEEPTWRPSSSNPTPRR